MEISEELVQHLGDLSKIYIDDSFSCKMQKELSSILKYMQILNSVNTDSETPLSHITSLENVMREDTVEPSFNRSCLLKNAPNHNNEAIAVPKAIE